jgi:hypothetical protein
MRHARGAHFWWLFGVEVSRISGSEREIDNGPGALPGPLLVVVRVGYPTQQSPFGSESVVSAQSQHEWCSRHVLIRRVMSLGDTQNE